MIDRPIERVIDLTDEAANRVLGETIEEARRRVASGDPASVRAIRGSFALAARDGSTVRLARSLDRPMRYFLAKQADGPFLLVADRIDAIQAYLESKGLDSQFHPSYTRMVPAHHVVEIRLLGCPDPEPTYARFLAPAPGTGPSAPAEIGRRYVEALASEIADWLRTLAPREPIGVCFSGGIDSGAVFLTTYHVLRGLGMHPGRLKAFTLSAGPGGADLAQARAFLEAVSLEYFLEPVEVPPDWIDPFEAVRVVEDYQPLDVDSAAVALALCRGIRERYPDWRFLVDGDGGDENLKDYPIGEDENSELTIRSVIGNPLLYQEGWGVGTLKHSLTYTGGQSRSATRTYAPARRHGFEGFSPFTRPALVEIAASLPFAELTGYDVERLYALKGEIVSRGVEAVTGLAMPVFPKRRFQHGALPAAPPRRPLPPSAETEYRRHLLDRFARVASSPAP